MVRKSPGDSSWKVIFFNDFCIGLCLLCANTCFIHSSSYLNRIFQDCIAKVVEKYGQLDCIVNNVGLRTLSWYCKSPRHWDLLIRFWLQDIVELSSIICNETPYVISEVYMYIEIIFTMHSSAKLWTPPLYVVFFC